MCVPHRHSVINKIPRKTCSHLTSQVDFARSLLSPTINQHKHFGAKRNETPAKAGTVQGLDPAQILWPWTMPCLQTTEPKTMPPLKLHKTANWQGVCPQPILCYLQICGLNLKASRPLCTKKATALLAPKRVPKSLEMHLTLDSTHEKGQTISSTQKDNREPFLPHANK